MALQLVPGGDGGGGLLDLEHLSPSRFVSLTFPNPSPSPPSHYSSPLRVAVLDSPFPPPSRPLTAVLLVPPGREQDWLFSTPPGHLHLLLSSPSDLSRLILVGSLHSPSSSLKPYARLDFDPAPIQASLLPLLLALSPRAAFSDGVPDIPFLSFEDSVLRITPVEALAGPVAGEMLVEDVELDRSPSPPEPRRRLRFKRMPNLVQTQVRLLPDSSSLASGSLQPEVGSLVQPYLRPMVAGLFLIAAVIEERLRSGSRPRCLCMGVGGGALLMALRTKLGFEVVGVEADEVVLSFAKRHFGLVEDECLRVCVGDGIEMIKSFAENDAIGDCGARFDAVMVDLDSGDVMSGVSAPPLEFIEKNVLLAVRSILSHDGIVVVNVIPPADTLFYEGLMDVFHEVFNELYELDVENGENFVLIATASPIGSTVVVNGVPFNEKLKEVISEELMVNIRKV